MATLTSQQLKDSYQSLVTIGDSITSDPTSGQLENGKGTPLTAVGIGTDSPSADLTVTDGTSAGTLSIGNDSASTSVRYLQFGETNDYSIQSNANSYLRFYAEGAERMRIHDSGDISFRDGATNEAFYWDASTARLGIGNTSPNSKLNVISNGVGTGIWVGPTNSSFGLEQWYNSADGAVYFDQKYNNNNGSIFFRTKTLGTPVNALTILGSGNVGIGTTSPNSNYKTHIEAGSGNNTGLLVTTTDNADVAQVIIAHDEGLQGGLGLVSDKTNNIAKIRVTNSAQFPLAFETRDAGGTQERMRITATGRVGIGETNPQVALDVNGTTESSDFRSFETTLAIDTATATTVLDLSGVGLNDRKAGWIFVRDTSGTRTGSFGQFMHLSDSGVGSSWLFNIQNGFSGSSLTLSGDEIKFEHAVGSTRTYRITVMYMNDGN